MRPGVVDPPERNRILMSAASRDARLDWLAAAGNRQLLTLGLRGFEKECLRVSPDGRLSNAPHSPEWGSALTHPWLTTDYSEALLEFVTPPLADVEAALTFLEELHAFVVQSAGDELLWPTSMPCTFESDQSVPIAQYGTSNEGRLRSIYRSGLGYRYGRSMQTIAGTHFNFSLPAEFWPAYRDFLGSDADIRAFRSDKLMGLVRNYRRVGWLITYLFGASPAFSKSFRPKGHARLDALSDDTWFAPYSTSLRMSDMGYRNSTQARLSISVNSLDEYLEELAAALTTREPGYEAIGVVVDGEYRQLNANSLQIENEFYSSIRPKPATKMPRLISALRDGGVEYVEVRTLDLNPFANPGVTAAQARFIEVLLIHCLTSDSEPISEAEQGEIDRRELAVAWEGRKPNLRIERAGEAVALKSWALELLDQFDEIAETLDGEQKEYSTAVSEAREAVRDVGRTLSARVLSDLQSGQRSFFQWAFETARRQKQYFLDYSFPAGRLEQLRELATQSLDETKALEAAAEPPFEEFLAEFLASGTG
jgi:glutamate--cysteine ligase